MVQYGDDIVLIDDSACRLVVLLRLLVVEWRWVGGGRYGGGRGKSETKSKSKTDKYITPIRIIFLIVSNRHQIADHSYVRKRSNAEVDNGKGSSITSKIR